MTNAKKALILIVGILLIDQILKIWIKTNMYLGEEIDVFGDWFKIHFLENNGMAFGLSFGGEFGKLTLSIFRIIAVGLIGYYIHFLSKKGAKTSLIMCIALVMAGAAGNIFDSAFYGLIFGEYNAYGEISELFPASGGYATFLHGKVVDMFYFPIIDTYLPENFPFWPGKHFIFFRPVFNIADASITIGVFSILLFHRDFLSSELHLKKDTIQDQSELNE